MANQDELNIEMAELVKELSNSVTDHLKKYAHDNERNTLLFIEAFREIHRLNPEAMPRVQHVMKELLVTHVDNELLTNAVKDAQAILKLC